MSSLRIKVVPGSSRTKVDGWLGESLKVRVTAKPEKGKANEAVISLLAETLRIPKEYIRIASGASPPTKVFKISNLTESEVRSLLPGRDA
jgi:uncharacterized protein (TIGR00251 family)